MATKPERIELLPEHFQRLCDAAAVNLERALRAEEKLTELAKAVDPSETLVGNSLVALAKAHREDSDWMDTHDPSDRYKARERARAVIATLATTLADPLTKEDRETIADGIAHYILDIDDRHAAIWQPYIDKLRAR